MVTYPPDPHRHPDGAEPSPPAEDHTMRFPQKEPNSRGGASIKHHLQENGGRDMIKTVGYAAQGATAPLDAFRFERREPGENDVRIEILHCGVCHSDLHTARNEWKGTTYPVVPGHEIVGRVSQVGSG